MCYHQWKNLLIRLNRCAIKKIEDLKAELLELKRSHDFISIQYDNLKDEYSKLIETKKKQEVKIKKLKAQSNELSAQGAKEAIKLDALDQYSRHQNLEIVGIPVTSNKDTNAIVKEIAELLPGKNLFSRYFYFSSPSD